jgi:hypothetical protein
MLLNLIFTGVFYALVMVFVKMWVPRRVRIEGSFNAAEPLEKQPIDHTYD